MSRVQNTLRPTSASPPRAAAAALTTKTDRRDTGRVAGAGFVAAMTAGVAGAQESPKPGPEHEVLKKRVGTWA